MELFENFLPKQNILNECISEYELLFPNFQVLQADIARDGIRKLDILVGFNFDKSFSVVVARDMG